MGPPWTPACHPGPGELFLEATLHHAGIPDEEGFAVDRTGQLTYVYLDGALGSQRDRSTGLKVHPDALYNVSESAIRELVDRLGLAEDRHEQPYNVTVAYAPDLTAAAFAGLCSLVVRQREGIEGRHPQEGCDDGASRTFRVPTSDGCWNASASCGGEGEDAFDALRERVEILLERASERAGVPAEDAP